MVNKKYVKIPTKLFYRTPWKKICVYLIGPYKIRRKGKETLVLKNVTMIDPVTRWSKVTQYDDNKVVRITNLVETLWQTWLRLCVCPGTPGHHKSRMTTDLSS